MLEKRPGELVSANHYNHVQIALKRLGQEIKLSIPRLKHLDLILQKDAWIVVDRVLHDLPIVSWADFEVTKRDNLYKPIRCELRLYHYAAHKIMAHTLNAMELMLGESLSALDTD